MPTRGSAVSVNSTTVSRRLSSRAKKPSTTSNATQITNRDYATLVGKPNKYRNKRQIGGYQSRKEASRAAELKLLEKTGKIRNLREQVKFELIPKQEGERACNYFADFTYNEGPTWPGFDGSPVVEDCKGMKTKDYIIKRKLMLWVHGITILET